MTDAVKSTTLRVPGAKIYYEVRGSGPVLLLISGGPTDAGAFADLARHLADRYTVVSYDPRGNSRSTLDSAPEDQQLDVHGDDAARLIEALGDRPADVFGTSGGAQIGLNLAARHPARVRMLVAHEPPCLPMLDDASKELAENQAIYDTYRLEGVEAAMHRFMAMAGMVGEHGDAPPAPPTPEAMETFGRIQSNFEYFIAHGLMPLSLYRPDVDTLRAGKTRVVVAVGEETVGQVAHRTGLALARQLGSTPAEFPGDHIGYGPRAAAFAERLHQVLSGG
jgi:pimeloyl-ACP methyl ester carboxylesterase